MIVFKDWNIRVSGQLAHQFDHLTRRIDIVGDLPEGWEWSIMVAVGNNLDIIYLESTANGVGVELTRDQLAFSGYYTIQLKGTHGEKVRHTNKTQAYVGESISGDAKWPEIPSEFSQIEQRILEINGNPPKPGSNGFWMIWNPDMNEYEQSTIPLPDSGGGGSNAIVVGETLIL